MVFWSTLLEELKQLEKDGIDIIGIGCGVGFRLRILYAFS